MTGPDANKKILLKSDPVTIGTDAHSSLHLSDPLVSFHHAVLFQEGPWWVWNDLDSENGSFLNGRLIKKHAIFPGETILIGQTLLEMKLPPVDQTDHIVLREGEWVQLPRMIAHELRNYLQFLDISVDHLKNDPEIEMKYHGEICSMKLASEKIDELVQALRDGCIHPSFQTINLVELIWEQLSFLEPITEASGVHLLTDIPESAVVIQADPNQLGRCIINMIKNAFEACDSGDTIHIQITETDQTILLFIKDTGSGMSPETLSSIWVPLFTTKPNGNGLGAFISRTIILRHHGTITAESELGKGTLIRIELPKNDGRNT